MSQNETKFIGPDESQSDPLQGNQLPELELRCRQCRGEGWYTDSGDRVTCETCDGAGYELTEFGVRVLRLVRHNFRPLFNKLIRSE
jgi:hypothetical protein